MKPLLYYGDRLRTPWLHRCSVCRISTGHHCPVSRIGINLYYPDELVATVVYAQVTGTTSLGLYKELEARVIQQRSRQG